MKAITHFFSMLQAQVFLLVGLTLLPALGGIFWLVRFSESRALEYAYGQAQLIGQATINHIELSLDQSRHLMQAAARSAPVQAMKPGACSSYALQVQVLHPGYATLSLLRPDGQVVCSQAASDIAPVAFAAAPWFVPAAGISEFRASGAWNDPVTNQWKAVLTYPVVQSQAGVVGILVLEINLEAWKDRVFQDIPEGALVTVVGTDHRMLMRSSLHQERVGKPIPERFVKAMENQVRGTLAETGVDNVNRLYAVDTLSVPGWQVWAAVPEQQVTAPYRDQMRNSLLTTLPLAFLLLGLTWWLLYGTVGPVKALASVAKAVAGGNVVARASMQGPQEIRAVAKEFNRMLDVTAQVQAELTDSLAFNSSVIDGLHSHIAVIDGQGVILMVNEAWRTYAKANGADQIADHFVGMNYLGAGQTSDHVDGADADGMVAGIRAVLSGERQYFENQYVCQSPVAKQWFQMRCTKLPGRSVRAVVAHLDITAVKNMEEQVRHLAYFDALTGLPNRRLLTDRLSQANAAIKRTGQLCALMVLDLDNFKPLNDQHGHAVGDLLLVQAGARISECVRSVDTVARFGGDEFVVLLTGLSREPQESKAEALGVAEKIRLRLGETYALSSHQAGQADTIVSHQCTATIGVTVFTHFESELDTIFKVADAAMYEAKAAGRNTVRFSHI